MQINHYYHIANIEKNSWWYMGRRNLLKLLKPKGRNISVLDLGCGTGANLKPFSGSSLIVGVDNSFDALHFTKKQISNVALADLQKPLPFKDNSFDVIICMDVIEHLPEDKMIFREMERILKPRGRAIISVPAFQFLWNDMDDLSLHQRRYKTSSIRKLFRQTSLKIEKLTYWNSTLFIPFSVFVMLRRAFITRKNRKLKEILNRVNPVTNSILYLILLFENLLIKAGIRMPFGISVLAVATK